MATGIVERNLSRNMDPSNVDYVQCETRLGYDNLTPGFATYLEKYYKKASPKDKAKCLELLTSLNIQKELSEQIKQQPNDLEHSSSRPISRSKSAVPTSRDYNDPQPIDFVRPRSPAKRPKTAMALRQKSNYCTTYKREFPPREPPSVVADRPSSSNAFTAAYDLSGPLGTTTYNAQFYKKPQKKADPIRTGTASGQRQNNPHPAQTFMVWRFPRKPLYRKQGDDSNEEEEITDELMDQVCRGKCRTTYQTDYLGVPQGVKMQEIMNLPEDWKSKVPYTLDTAARYSYQSPEKIVPLQGNLTRYGCNKLKNRSAVGTVPTCSSRFFHVNPRTSYTRDYVDPTVDSSANLRDISKTLNAEMLDKHMISANPNEREALEEVINAMKNSPPGSRRGRGCAPSATPMSRQFKPSWHSSWTGPM